MAKVKKKARMELTTSHARNLAKGRLTRCQSTINKILTNVTITNREKIELSSILSNLNDTIILWSDRQKILLENKK